MRQQNIIGSTFDESMRRRQVIDAGQGAKGRQVKCAMAVKALGYCKARIRQLTALGPGAAWAM